MGTFVYSLVLFGLACLTTLDASAQSHYPLAASEYAQAIGEVGTVELYHKIDPVTRAQFLIFYTYEGTERWVAVRISKAEIDDFYTILDKALRDDASGISFRGSTIKLWANPLVKTQVRITDEFGQSVYFKINRNQLKTLFNK